MSERQVSIGSCPHCETGVSVLCRDDDWFAIHDCGKPFHYDKPYPGSDKPFKGKQGPA